MLRRIGKPEHFAHILGELSKANLAFAHRRLGLLALADIAHHGNEVLGPAGAVAHHGNGNRSPKYAAVLAYLAMLDGGREGVAAHEVRPQPLRHAAVLDMHDFVEAALPQLGLGVAEHVAVRLVGAQKAPVGRGMHDADRGMVESGAVARLGGELARGLDLLPTPRQEQQRAEH